MNDPQDTRAALPSSPRGGAWRQSSVRTLLSGIQVAIVGGVLGAVAESQVAAHLAGAAGAGLPLRLGAVGSFVATHLVLWVPLLAVLSIPLAVVFVRPGAARRLGPVEGVQAGLLVIVGGVLAAPGDLMLVEKLTGLRFAASAVGALLAGCVLWLVLRAFTSRARQYRRMRVVLHVLTVCCLVATGVSVGAMVRTPFAGPGVYRLPEARPAGGGGSGGRPNILLVMLDTLRADRMSCYGYLRQTTPELDRFAAEATLYERAVPNGIWTVPSHASLFTGLAVRTHGMNHDHMVLDDEYDTLAELLAAAGYRTVCLSNNPWVNPRFNMTQGFAVDVDVHAVRRLAKSFAEGWCDRLGIVPPLPWLQRDLGGALNNYLLAQWVDGRANRDRPFFVFLNYMDVHLPYDTPAEARRKFLDAAGVRRSYMLRRKVYGPIVNVLTARYNFLDNECISEQDECVLSDLYDSCVWYLDSRMGELLRAVEQRGLSQNTIVIFVSDHGEALGEHDQWAHESCVYDTLVWVPLLVRDGRTPAEERIREPVLVSDLFPTILRWAGVGFEEPAGSPSRDLEGGDDPGRVVVGEQTGTNEHRLRWAKRRDPELEEERFRRKLRAAVDGRYKYIRASDGQDELFDLAADPGETRNLIGELPEIAASLRHDLDDWLGRVPAYEATGTRTGQDLEPELRDALRDLGYIDEGG
ncbi:MAG: sulfatase-like hydrolase/transferase [Phycisphaerales bacterium]|nr:MAG: sulfatase-like hydrolase/transferase [Phycisphaerales bacterium]